ncbi:hypothetical protein E4U19_007665 [Claviceps sp. Clav32 group G5]|nr:hypothetical protein E4U19_007665 [Claviceps sp. Clav32 group G5]KAG6043769.1 hypothetical protein E4U39_004155 [Claviceps sp. Clav50 group G5]
MSAEECFDLFCAKTKDKMTGVTKKSFSFVDLISGSTLCQTNWLSQTVCRVSYHSPQWLTLESLNDRVGKLSVWTLTCPFWRSRRNLRQKKKLNTHVQR